MSNKSTKYSNVKSTDRNSAEVAENLKSTHVDAPDERFQASQQVAPMMDTTTSVKADSFIRKPVKSKGNTLKTETIAEVLTGKGVGGPAVGGSASPAAFGLKAASFSGDTGTILGNVSGTPSMSGPYQGQSRVDKRLSDANKDINFNASEQILVEYDMIPALADSQSTVGYNGNAKNVSARSQKKTGFTSAEPLYDRSLDMLAKDGFVFTSGQVVKQDKVGYQDYPTISQDGSGEDIEFSETRGNYSPREIEITFTRDDRGAYVSRFRVLEDDLSCDFEKDVTVNNSSSNHIIDMNRAELARQTIDADAGSPTAQHFNPLGRSVAQPTATLAYLQDIENTMGAEVFAAYKYANKARAHFLNRTAKDGQDLTGPAIDALYGHLCGAVDLDGIKHAINYSEADGFFSRAGMQYGSAALMIPLFDSANKYKTKADLVNQPRGLKMHIQTADNNMNPFRCKKEFVAALNSLDVYSTIDHDYDPTAPVFITDNVRLIHPYSWAGALEFTRDSNRVKTYQSKAFQYYYASGSGLNTYAVTVGEPILNGIAYFFDLHANEAYRALNGNSNGTITLHIPVVHSTMHFSLWDLLVCASTPYIIYERTNALKDILDYEMFYKYPLQGNVAIAEANPLNAVNYGTLSPYAPITVKEMLPSSAMRWRFPETFIPVNRDVMMPYYFNERSYNFVNDNQGRDTTLQYNYSNEYTTPVVRSGMKLAGLDEFFGMEVKDQLLITDRMTRLPFDRELKAFKGYIYKYSQDSDGLIVANSDNLAGSTAADYMATPRLCGWYFDAPAKTCCVYDGQLEDGEWVPALGTLPSANTIALRSVRPSYRAIMYKGVYSARDKIVNESLDVGSVNVNRAQAFTQVWGMKWAGFDVQSKYFDLILSINQAISYNNEVGDDPRFVTINERAQFAPFTFGPYAVTEENGVRVATNTAKYANANTDLILFSPHYMMWTLLQKLPFIINPFENSDDNRPAADPFGIAYIFGLAGFVSANYDEELYNRANRVQNEGYGYTSDPITSASPIFKDAYAKTQIG